MPIGLYLHVPFCLQRCYYCDFATYTQAEVNVSTQDYLAVLLLEIAKSGSALGTKNIKTIYFGGGTPSLLSVAQFESILGALQKNNFIWDSSVEITIEINPATLSAEKIKSLQGLGVNRFSVGAQTFNDALLKKINRKHNSQDTRDTLDLFNNLGCNFSLDLLFALPNQTLEDILNDLDEIEEYNPPHISPYYLTIPDHHILTVGRPSEEAEIKMIQAIRERLTALGYHQYEISNFSISDRAKSKHNLIYWNDESYLGFGLSSHSYLKEKGPFGTRFSNPKNISEYLNWVHKWNPQKSVLNDRKNVGILEELRAHEALTDFCHISLRKYNGLSKASLIKKFGAGATELVTKRLRKSEGNNLVFFRDGHWVLTDEGKDLSNLVFLELTFLGPDYPTAT